MSSRLPCPHHVIKLNLKSLNLCVMKKRVYPVRFGSSEVQAEGLERLLVLGLEALVSAEEEVHTLLHLHEQ